MRSVNWIFILIGVAGLIAVRVVEDRVFYDPFLNYFRASSKIMDIPDYNTLQLIVSHVGRFLLNLLFSGFVLQGFFKNWHWTKQGLLLMSLVFVFLLPLYLYSVATDFSLGHLFSFYVRRFLIQPLVLIVLVPMFYYRKKLEQQN